VVTVIRALGVFETFWVDVRVAYNGDTKDLCCDAFFAVRVPETAGYYCCEVSSCAVSGGEYKVGVSADVIDVIECLECEMGATRMVPRERRCRSPPRGWGRGILVRDGIPHLRQHTLQQNRLPGITLLSVLDPAMASYRPLGRYLPTQILHHDN
jgi:hypothetical protein